MPVKVKRACVIACVAALFGNAPGRDLRLVESVKKGDLAAVNALLKQGADVNMPLNDGATALHWAVYRHDLQTAELLIRAGANLNAVNDLSVSPLWLAAANGNLSLAALLLAAGADPNIAPRPGDIAKCCV